MTLLADAPAGPLPRLYELGRSDLSSWCECHGAPAYRADQIRRWIFGKRVNSFLDMHDVPAALRGRLAESFALFPSEVVQHAVASDRTEKLLLRLTDRELIECVLMREGEQGDSRVVGRSPDRPTLCDRRSHNQSITDEWHGQEIMPQRCDGERGDVSPPGDSNSRDSNHRGERPSARRTICISTQVGCGMGCVFCASGLRGLQRNLTTGEILEQVLRLDRLLAPGENITNVVVMGIGEPLANLTALLPALDSLCDKGGLGLSARRITISTVGLPEKIRDLAETGKAFNLAVSLHAPNDDLRNQLVPVNAKIGIAAILDAADDFFRITGRRVTYEYVLLSGLNDAPEQARELGKLLKPRIAHVNLIPMNGVRELPFVEPTAPRTQEFVRMLEQFGVPVTVRKRKGADIDAACGQLRLHQLQENAKPNNQSSCQPVKLLAE